MRRLPRLLLKALGYLLRTLAHGALLRSQLLRRSSASGLLGKRTLLA